MGTPTMHTSCLECQRPLIGEYEWKGMSPAERAKIPGFQRHAGRGLCNACHTRHARANTLGLFPLKYTRPGEGKIKYPPLSISNQVVSLVKTIITPFVQDIDLPCTDDSVEPDWWFSLNAEDTELAQSICVQGHDGKGCPVRQLCLAGALKRKEVTGVWGGEVIDHGEIRKEAAA